MKLRSLGFGVSTVCLALLVCGCGAKKKEALVEFEKVEAACKAGEKDKAKEIALKARDSNEVFKKALDGATESVADKTKVNICGALVQAETKMRMEHD